VHRRFHFPGHGACFFFSLPSFYFLFFIFVFYCPLLVSLPFICYLTNKDLERRRFHFTSHGACFFFFLPSFHHFLFLFGSLVSSFGFSPLHLLFNKQGLGA
jgi:hypothetical protein